MKAKKSIVAAILVLGILGAPSLGADAGKLSPNPEASPQKVVSKAALQKERNKKFIQGMNALPKKIEALLKKSPDLTAGS